jgi:hypothetical protein
MRTLLLPTDKGNIIVIMNKTDYREKMTKLLDDPAHTRLKMRPHHENREADITSDETGI